MTLQTFITYNLSMSIGKILTLIQMILVVNICPCDASPGYKARFTLVVTLHDNMI